MKILRINFRSANEFDVPRKEFRLAAREGASQVENRSFVDVFSRQSFRGEKERWGYE